MVARCLTVFLSITCKSLVWAQNVHILPSAIKITHFNLLLSLSKKRRLLFVMADENDIKAGLELDKIDLSQGRGDPVPPPLPLQQTGGKAKKKNSSKSSKLQVFILIAGVAALFATMFFLWDQAIIDLPLLESNVAKRALEKYVSVGPIMANVSKDQHVKITVMIECKNKRLRERVTAVQPIIKNNLMMVMNSKEAKPIIDKKEYSELKPEFLKQINSLLKGSPVKNIYFSQIVRY
jgi:flagellar basal body-associated protein FliL